MRQRRTSRKRSTRWHRTRTRMRRTEDHEEALAPGPTVQIETGREPGQIEHLHAVMRFETMVGRTARLFLASEANDLSFSFSRPFDSGIHQLVPISTLEPFQIALVSSLRCSGGTAPDAAFRTFSTCSALSGGP